METVWFVELPPYPVRSFTHHNEQVRAEVSMVIVYNGMDPLKHDKNT
jgi:hypothetical protein